MKEQWKDVKGYEGIYKVSDNGNVTSTATGSQRPRKLSTDRDGYKHITLVKNGLARNYFVHRLVLEAFVKNPNNYPVVNHKDENRGNNNADNLEWCTIKYNRNYGSCPDTVKRLITELQGMAVVKKDFANNIIGRYQSIAEAGRQNKMSAGNIGNCCRGNAKQCGGYIWEYAL